MASSDYVDGLAAVVLAHRAPQQVLRLLDALHGADVFVHCDIKTDQSTAATMLEGVRDRGGIALPRRDVRVSSWSLVRLELDALRTVLESSSAPHIAVMSGADYPLVSRAVLSEALASWSGRTWMRNVPLPYPPWNSRFSEDGGLWRWRWYFPTIRDNVVGHDARVVALPARRRIPAEFELRSSPHWKVYARTDAQRLLDVLDANPHLIRYGRHTFIPEESFIPSVLASTKLLGDQALAPSGYGPWYVKWPTAGTPSQQHPDIVENTDMEQLIARAAGGRAGAGPWQRPVFARKFSGSATTYDLVEEIVWPATAR